MLAYGPIRGLPELRQEIKRYFEKLDIMLSVDDVMVTTAGSEAIVFALMAVATPATRCWCPSRSTPTTTVSPTMAGISWCRCPPTSRTASTCPPGRVRSSGSPRRPRRILFCSPNNPTGAVFTRKDLEMLAGLAKEKNLWLLADEVYREFIYDGGVPHQSSCTSRGSEDRAIMLDSVSKRFSACGARVGCLVSRNPHIMQAALKLGQARLCPPTIEQAGAIAGYKNIHKYLTEDGRPSTSTAGHRRLRRAGQDSGAVFKKPEGAFYIMPQLPIDDADQFAHGC